MIEKNRKFILIFVVMNILYLGFVFGNKLFSRSTGSAPTISFDSDTFVISVKDGEDKLLSGVKATDKEDGDISNSIFIYSISPFDKDKYRTITYAVFDSDNHMMTTSRKFRYTDYSAPKFSSTEPLINITYETLLNGTIEDSSYMNATSSVDGNISNKISLSTFSEGMEVVYTYSVTDSTGTTSTIELTEKVSINNVLKNNIDIKLKKYILYVKKGAVLDLSSYVEDIKTTLGKQNELKPYVQVETNYNMHIPGTYEARYTLNRSNGDYGLTKMIIIVE